MNIKVKDNECWGTVFVVLHKIDGTDSVRVFTDIEPAIDFSKKVEGNIFIETLNREG